MKKILALSLCAVMLLGVAAVSMAEVTINGDFRYSMIEDESDTSDSSYGIVDTRVRVTGDLSETLKATVNIQAKETNNGGWETGLDEFMITAKYDWGTAKMGYMEYNFTPNRVELSTSGCRVIPKNDGTFEFDIPLTEEMGVDLLLVPYEYAGKYIDDGSYAVAFNYKAENWGLKVSYWDLIMNGYDLTCIDAYYKLNDDMKLFANASDYSYNDGSSTNTAKLGKNEIIYDEGFDPVIGFAWSKIGGSKLGASLEYAFNSRKDVDAGDFNEYIAKATYKLDNGMELELYHYVVGDDVNKDMLRLRYRF